MKALWSQEKTDWDGRFFKLKGCVSNPKPLSKPYPAIVSAGISDEGLAFGPSIPTTSLSAEAAPK